MNYDSIISDIESEIDRYPVAGPAVSIATHGDAVNGAATTALNARLTHLAQNVATQSWQDATSSLARTSRRLTIAQVLVPPSRLDTASGTASLDAIARAWQLAPARHGRIGLSLTADGLVPALVLAEGIASIPIASHNLGNVLVLPDFQQQEVGGLALEPSTVFPGDGPLTRRRFANGSTVSTNGSKQSVSGVDVDWYARLERNASRIVDASMRGTIGSSPIAATLASSIAGEQGTDQWPPSMFGSRIDPLTGALLLVEIEIEMQGPLPIAWRRWFNSAWTSEPRSLGRGHAHEFDASLRFDLDGIRYIPPSGVEVCFPPLRADETSVDVIGLRLTRETATRYRLDNVDRATRTFAIADDQRTGRLVMLRDDAGAVEFRYDSYGVLDEIIDSRGRRLHCEVDSHGRLVGLVLVESEDGHAYRLLAHGFDAHGRLTRTIDSAGAVTALHWNDQHQLVAIVYDNGNTLSFDYDHTGRCVHVTSDSGRKVG